MLERELPGYFSKVEIAFTLEQAKPFDVKKVGSKWQLSVNKVHLESKGFSPDEINGSIFLEEECLKKRVDLTTTADVVGLLRWQELATEEPKAAAFKSIFERLGALNSLTTKNPEKARLARKYLGKIATHSAGSALTDQLFSSVLKTGLGYNEVPSEGLVANVISNLQKQEIIDCREVSTLGALSSGDLSPASRAAWFEERFLPRLRFLDYQDEQAKKKNESEYKDDSPPSPPEQSPLKGRGQEQTGMSEIPPTPAEANDAFSQHRGKEQRGAVGQPLFTVDPAYSGYWEEDSYDSIDENTGKLSKSDSQRAKTGIFVLSDHIVEASKRKIAGYSGTNLFALPIPPGFQLTQQSLKNLRDQGANVLSDVEGHIFIQSPTNTLIEPEIAINNGIQRPGIASFKQTVSEQKMPSAIASELERINTTVASDSNKIEAWVKYIQGNFVYPQDEQVEALYSAVDKASSRINQLGSGRQLDCHLARELFLAGLKRLELPNIEWRAVNGHYVSSATENNTSELHSGTGHSWVKIRQNISDGWTIIDPTPPGDPACQGDGLVDEVKQLFTEEMTKDNLAEIEKDVSALGQKKSFQTDNDYLLEFARESGLSTEEAQRILNTLEHLDRIQDRQGRSLLARLTEQFDRIIQEYTSVRQDDTGLVEMSRGRDLEDPVAAFIDLQAGNIDPTGFTRKRLIEEKEQYYGGWDLELVLDGSSSMGSSLGGGAKYLVQRDMSYLLHRGVHSFSQEAQKRKLRLITPLKVRSSQYIFRGNRVEEIKPLSEEFTPPQMAQLWKRSAQNIGGGTPAHLGLQAIYDKIPMDEAQLLENKKLLKVVALISDGGYDDPSRVRSLIKRLSDINVIVAEFRITDARSLEELPQNVAEKVIEAARVLMPERVRK